jgi:hypothetical protein
MSDLLPCFGFYIEQNSEENIQVIDTRLHDEELHSLYSSPEDDQIKEYEMGDACSTTDGAMKCTQSFGRENWKE